jgi:hypothetical protein
MTARIVRVCLVAALLNVAALATPVIAQTAPVAKLLVTVVDQTGAVLPNAKVTIAGTEAATKAATLAPINADDKGQAPNSQDSCRQNSKTSGFVPGTTST